MCKKKLYRIVTIPLTIIIILLLTYLFGEWYLGQKGYGYRRTPAIPRENHEIRWLEPTNKEKRALFTGCSYTYGIGVNLEDNFVSRLQKLIPNCSFDNCGQPGSEAAHALHEMSWLTKKHHYDLIVYSIIRLQLGRQPPCKLQLDGKIVLDPMPDLSRTIYSAQDFPIYIEGGDHQLTVQRLDFFKPGANVSRLLSFYGDFGQLYARIGHEALRDKEEITKYKYLIRAMYTCARNHGAKLAVIALDNIKLNTVDYQGLSPIEYLANSPLTPNDTPVKIHTFDASYPVDIMSKPELHTVKSPIDNGDHPSALVHKYYAERISEFIKKEHLLD